MCREPGARVKRDMTLGSLNFHLAGSPDRAIEVIVRGLLS